MNLLNHLPWFNFIIPATYICATYVAVGAFGPRFLRWPLTLATIGLAAWLTVIITYFAPVLLAGLRVVFPLAIVIILAVSKRARCVSQEDIVLLVLILLPGLLLAAVVFSSQDQSPLTTAQNFWSHPLPPDNVIPFLFGEHMRSGYVPSPLLGDWLSSDRPPLLSGIYLIAAASFSEWGYQGVASIAQLTVVPTSFWLALRLGGSLFRSLAASALVATSPLVLVNSIYVWPKLQAAAFVLTCVGLLLKRMTRLESSLFALLIAFAVLSHGGVLFSILGVPAWLLVQKRSEAVRLAPYAGLSLLTVLPWIGYQRFIDPPGNRLLRWHLAGTMEPGADTLGAISSLYQSLGPDGIARSAELKVQSLLASPFAAIVHFSDVEAFRIQAFFHPIPAMGVGILIAIAAGTRTGTQRVRDVQQMTLFGIGLFLILAQSASGPGFVVHESSYAFWIAPLIAGSVASRGWLLALAVTLSGALSLRFFLIPAF